MVTLGSAVSSKVGESLSIKKTQVGLVSQASRAWEAAFGLGGQGVKAT